MSRSRRMQRKHMEQEEAPVEIDNLDPTEIAKFDRLASRWWDPGGECKALHDINPLRMRYIMERTPLRGARVLDVGCGGGILSESLAACGSRVTGIDAGIETLVVARRHAAKSGLDIDYRQTTVETLAFFEKDPFDIITCMELLEHVPNPRSIVRACSRMMKPGGSLFFATVNRNVKSFIFAIIGAEYMLRLLPIGSHRHSKLIKPRELSGWGSAFDLEEVHTSGLGYNPFSRRYFLTKDVSVNYFMHFRRSVPG